MSTEKTDEQVDVMGTILDDIAEGIFQRGMKIMDLAKKRTRTEAEQDELVELQEEQKLTLQQFDNVRKTYTGLLQIRKATGNKNVSAFSNLQKQMQQIKSNQGDIVTFVNNKE